jgi:hypothetical protein
MRRSGPTALAGARPLCSPPEAGTVTPSDCAERRYDMQYRTRTVSYPAAGLQPPLRRGYIAGVFLFSDIFQRRREDFCRRFLLVHTISDSAKKSISSCANDLSREVRLAGIMETSIGHGT